MRIFTKNDDFVETEDCGVVGRQEKITKIPLDYGYFSNKNIDVSDETFLS